MNFFRISPLVLSFALIACATPTDHKPSALDGTWVAAPETGRPSGSYQRSLTFGSDGSFISEFRSYGIYPGQPQNELSAWQRIEGSYRTEGDRLIFQSARLVSWDRFYGADSPVKITEPYPYGTIYENARYEMQGPQLILRFTIYPADAPEPAVIVFTLAP